MDGVFASLVAGVSFKDKDKAAKSQARAAGQILNAGVAGPDPKAAGIPLFGRSEAPAAGAVLMGQTAPPEVHTHNPVEEAAVLRKAFRIRVSGGSVGAPLHDFEELKTRFGAAPRLLENLQANGFLVPTPIQRQAVPALMEGAQLLAVAPTGSGKTLAFMLPIVIKLRSARRKATAANTGGPATDGTAADAAATDATRATEDAGGAHGMATDAADAAVNGKVKRRRLGASDDTGANGATGENGAAGVKADSQGGGVSERASVWPEAVKAIVLSPTHELAGQQFRVLQRVLPGSGLKASLLTAASAKGTNFSKVDVLVANPMKLDKLIQSKRIDCSQVQFLVLDEADKLFELGFLPQIDSIIAACTHPDLTRALFSATLPDTVEQLARSVMHSPLRVTVGERNSAAISVRQRLLFVGREGGKLVALRQLIASGLHPPVLVFVGSKDRARVLHKELVYDGIHVDSIHSDQPQVVRNAAVDNFRAGSTWLLVATDLVGRGMDFIGVNTVVNYDFPRSTTDYIHRVGRTGRGGRGGEAITFYTEDDGPYVRSVANVIKASGGEVPEWMLHLPKTKDQRTRRRKVQTNLDEEEVGSKENGAVAVKKDKKTSKIKRPGTVNKGMKRKRALTEGGTAVVVKARAKSTEPRGGSNDQQKKLKVLHKMRSGKGAHPAQMRRAFKKLNSLHAKQEPE